jgi:hypothetical protein
MMALATYVRRNQLATKEHHHAAPNDGKLSPPRGGTAELCAPGSLAVLDDFQKNLRLFKA